MELLRAASARAGSQHGAVEDKLGLPGLQKLAHVVAAQARFGRVVSASGMDFGWWVFDGAEVTVPAAELELPAGQTAAG